MTQVSGVGFESRNPIDGVSCVPARKTKQKTAPIHVVFGPEAFLKRQAIASIVDTTLADADRSLAISEYDGAAAGLTAADVLDDLRTLPFLTECRLVLVRDADAFITRHRQALEEYVGNPSPTGVLLLECRSFPATTRLYKRVNALGGLVPCEAIKSGQAPSWVTSRARNAHQIQIDPQAAAMLVDLIGDDLGLLDNELQKLGLYVGERRRVTVADVAALVQSIREEKVWGILSAIAAGDQAGALTMWEQVLETDRAAEYRAIGGLAFKVRQLLNAKRAEEAGASQAELGRILVVWNDPRRLRAELAAFTTAQAEAMLCRLLEADVASKTGGVSVRSSIEAFIVEMCRRRQRVTA
jgi:DNA polymerase III subunit delta